LQLQILENTVVLQEITVVNIATNHYIAYVVLDIISQQYKIVINTFVEAESSSLKEYLPHCIWMEEETWEMFGVLFLGNKPERLLTEYLLDFFPLRKNYTFGEVQELGFYVQQDHIRKSETYKTKKKFSHLKLKANSKNTTTINNTCKANLYA
jgi:NADH:ubiquinone oxidoreductase subunit C